MGARAKLDILATQVDQFRCSQPGLHRHDQQGAVATPRSSARVRSCQQGLDFVAVEEVDRAAGIALRRHGQDSLRQGRVPRLLHGDVAEEGADRDQAGIAGPCVIAALDFKVVQEATEELGVQITEFQVGRRFVQFPQGGTDEQAEGVPVAGDGMGAGPALLLEAVGEECGQEAGEVGCGRHAGSLPVALSRRLATSWSSSGVAVRYQ